MKPFYAKYVIPALVLGATLPGAALRPSPAQAAPYYGGGYDRGPAGGELTWSGDVDDTVLVSLHRGDVRTRAAHGKDPGNVSAQVSGRLPEAPVAVFLRDREGRGRVRIVQQPSPDNDFTAVVRLRDPQSGRGHYNFTLAWRPLPRRRFGF